MKTIIIIETILIMAMGVFIYLNHPKIDEEITYYTCGQECFKICKDHECLTIDYDAF